MAQQERFLLALQHFDKALARLHEVLAEPTETAIVRDALIQRFEFTFEAAWKAAYRWLRARGNDVDEEAAAVIPEAFARRLIAGAGCVKWRTRHDSNVWPLPSEGNALSS